MADMIRESQPNQRVGQAPLMNPAQMSNINVGAGERYISLLGGVAMIWLAMRQRGMATLLMSLIGGEMIYRGVTGNCPIYSGLKINTAVKTNEQAVSVPHEQGIHVTKSVTINRPVEELYSFWRNFENLPRIMNHLESVTIQDADGKRSHWVAKAPLGATVEWDAEIVNEVRNEVIGWRSLANAQIANAGSVRFRPATGGRGTEVRITLEYMPPAGKLGVAMARLLGEEPELQVEDDLRRFKQLMESGEVSTTDGQPSGPLMP
jgi:uncharacterized membrane protein